MSDPIGEEREELIAAFCRQAAKNVAQKLKDRYAFADDIYAAFEDELTIIGAAGGLPYPKDGPTLSYEECEKRLIGHGLHSFSVPQRPHRWGYWHFDSVREVIELEPSRQDYFRLRDLHDAQDVLDMVMHVHSKATSTWDALTSHHMLQAIKAIINPRETFKGDPKDVDIVAVARNYVFPKNKLQGGAER